MNNKVYREYVIALFYLETLKSTIDSALFPGLEFVISLFQERITQFLKDQKAKQKIEEIDLKSISYHDFLFTTYKALRLLDGEYLGRNQDVQMILGQLKKAIKLCSFLEAQKNFGSIKF